MRYFLAKTEPSSYSIGQLRSEHHTLWDGVRNPQALRAIRDMSPGDRVLIYHSGGESAIVGWAEVLSPAQTDTKDEKSAAVELRFGGLIEPHVTLKEVKATHAFDDWALVRQSRLSTMAVPETFVKWLKKQNAALPF
jgi:predicted RNA-binding protein with PUA-like domain